MWVSRVSQRKSCVSIWIFKQFEKSRFYGFLKDESISKEDYLLTLNVWNAFKMKTMSDYHDIHLKTDVLLLADVFEIFIGVCLKIMV